jgi:chromosome segregation ATPase
MMNKSGAGILWFRLGIFLLGAGLAGWGTGAWGQEIPAVSQADETQAGEPSSTAGQLEERMREVRSQIDRIDNQMAALEDEEKALMAQAREAQRGQFEVRRQLLDGDEELREMVLQIEAMQRDMHTLQETLAQRMAEHTNYAEFNTRQTAILGRTGAIQKETMELANDRVRIQLELQTLEKQWAGMAEAAAAPEPEGDGTPLSAEDPDQL